MADIKSSEGIKPGKQATHGIKPEPTSSRPPAPKPTNLGSITINADVSDALKGLKAVQREAKKATAALKELDDIKKHTCPECKTISLEIKTLRADNIVLQDKKCEHCGWSYNDDFSGDSE